MATSSPRSSTAAKVMTLSNGPSMKSCTWLCWSVAPIAATGVGPACTSRPARSTRLPRLSAQSWRYHSANSRSRSVYGIRTWIRAPSSVSAAQCSAA